MAPCLPFTRARPRFGAATPSENGHNEVVIALLQAGADPDAPRSDVGATPVYVAAQKGHLAVVKTLLAAGADPDAMDETGKTASDVAKAWGFPKIVEALGPTVTISDASPAAPPPSGKLSSTDAQDEEASPPAARKGYRMPEGLQPEKMEL